MNKTPISILQEMMIKKEVPNYELIHNGGGTHMNTFMYKVSCDGLSTTGTGRSKKEAKHEAAKAMLEAIAVHRGYPQLPASPAQSPIRTPLPPEVPKSSPNEPFVNAIGTLQELCAENNLQAPEYIQISETGPPHAKTFTIQCKVATFKETGIAKTKKQAKQDAAKKMLDKLTDLVPNFNIVSNTSKLKSKDKEVSSIELAKSRYFALSRLPVSKKINLGVELSQYHLHLKNSLASEIRTDLIEKLQSIAPEDHSNTSDEFMNDLYSRFKDILSNIGFEVSLEVLKSEDPAQHIAVIKINTSPDVVQIARGETYLEAKFDATLKSIDALLLLLK